MWQDCFLALNRKKRFQIYSPARQRLRKLLGLCLLFAATLFVFFERLIAIAREKEDEAVYLTERIGELIPNFLSSKSSNIEKPAVSFFEGIDAVKHVVMDVMYAKSHKVDLIVPAQTFFWGFGEEFIKKYN